MMDKEAEEQSQQQARKSKPNSRQDKSKPNSRQDKNIANSRQTENKEMCKKPKADREETMKHTEDLHIQHKVNEKYIENESGMFPH